MEAELGRGRWAQTHDLLIMRAHHSPSCAAHHLLLLSSTASSQLWISFVNSLMYGSSLLHGAHLVHAAPPASPSELALAGPRAPLRVAWREMPPLSLLAKRLQKSQHPNNCSTVSAPPRRRPAA